MHLAAFSVRDVPIVIYHTDIKITITAHFFIFKVIKTAFDISPHAYLPLTTTKKHVLLLRTLVI